MSVGARRGIVAASVAMVLAIGLTPFLLMLLGTPRPVAAETPGAAGNGVYVRSRSLYFKLFPTARLGPEFPKDAFDVTPDTAVCVKSRQYDFLTAYGIYAFPSGQPVGVAKRLAGGMLTLEPDRPLARGRYVVKISRDGAWGGEDYYFLIVR